VAKVSKRILYVLAAAACFAVGVGASRWFAPAPRPAPEPQILIDGRNVQLLPDASLHLELPRGFDGGAP
jgi:hypothetical protein